MRFTSTTALVIATLSIAACGGDDGGVTPIDAKRIDSTGGPDSTSSTCAVPASVTFGDSTGFNLERGEPATPDGTYVLSASYYIAEDMSAALGLELYSNYAPFDTGGAVDARTVTIDAVQANYATCGACVRLYSLVAGEIDTTWMPNGGSITITQIDPTVGGTYALTFNNLALRQVNITAGTFETTDHPSGCATTFTGGSLAGMIVAPAANKTAGNAKLMTAPVIQK